MRIIVNGYIVRGPLGGLVWHHLQYVLGLHRLGHKVHFMEDSDDYDSCYDPSRGVVDKDPSYGLNFAAEVFQLVGLDNCWGYFDAHSARWLGPCGAKAPDLFRSADLLLNISGVNAIREWTQLPPHRVLIDTDPVFTQVRHCTDERARERAATHTGFFTFGENFGTALSSVPGDGFPWLPTRQPVVMDLWPITPGHPNGHFTTVMQWDSYPAAELGGRKFGMKSASFAPYLEIPARVGSPLEIALGSATAPRDTLRNHKWILRDPLEVTRTAAGYQDYIRASKGEFSVAKEGYVITRSGWFSERSAIYLASGRPVVTQDTGFSAFLKTGDGLLAYDSPDAAATALQQVSADYHHHCRAARSMAEQFFDSDSVLRDLLRLAVC